MTEKWLNLFFKLSGFIFKTKQQVVKSENWVKVLPQTLIIIFFELGFAIISLPMYLIVSPKAIQERGFIFPFAEKDNKEETIKVYTARRRISLTTGLGAGTFVVLKVLLIAITSLYLLGGQALLAATENWTFDTAGDYTYDNSKIEVIGGAAQLKDMGGVASGATSNSGFDSGTTGWTYADWDQGGGEVNIIGAHVISGGNPDAYINISAPLGKDDELGGYWRQPFTTTVANPTTQVSFDWLVTAFDSTPLPNTFKLLVFVDTGTGVPVIGQEVWSSGEISGTSSWAASGTIDVSSKVTTAGTYYLKVAMWVETPGSNSGPFTVGYDNVSLNWSKTTIAYATDHPTINPTTSLTPELVTNWDSFTETATKNGGEIYYQLSDDDGATWQYWNGSSWTTAGASNYNTASIVNTNIPSFSATNKKISWKAYLESNGTQQVILDNIAIGYTENDPTHIQNLAPTQNIDSSLVNIDYELADAQSDPASLVVYEYSLTGDFSGEEVIMTASTTDASHNGTTGLSSSPTGVAHTFVWDAQTQLGAIYDASVYVRLRGNDGINTGDYATSTAFAVDYVVPVVSNVLASQVVGSTDVTITYDLTDDTADNLYTEIGLSGDGGSTWVVPTVSVTGDIGSGVTTGTSKSITWSAGTDYDEYQKSNMQVRVRTKDKYQNQGEYANSANFNLDTLNPTTNVSADLQAQSNAGDTTVLIAGSFTENNPNTNDFYVAINGGVYGSATLGTVDTASPASQATAVEATLDGNDYISGVKIIHTDDFGQTKDNENILPSATYKYVKPYTPQAPILSSPITTQLDLTINKHASEDSGLEYLIAETTTGQYVQADGTLGASEIWQTDSAWGTVTVTGLNSPVANYIFKVKSRNPSDTLHAVSSESAYSATAQITNTAPSISYGVTTQTIDGTRYVVVNYTGTDGQGDINSLTVYEYSTDNSTWNTMTEKSGVGSEGVSNLVFLSGGSLHNFAWDSGTDLSNVEDDTVYVQLRSSDTLTNSTLSASSAFAIDNKNPVVSNVSATQDSGARTITITYDLVEHNNSTVELDISNDGGSTWTVTDTSVTGDVGAGVSAGTSKSIIWNAGADFDNEYQTDIQVRVRATDTKGNIGAYTNSANFTVDTKDPVVSNMSGSQDSGLKTFTFHYDVSEDLGDVTVALAVSSDGGSTWAVPVTSASGDIGLITTGSNKTITWDGASDYSGYEENDMQIRITATDQFTNNANNYSAYFSLDTQNPRITNVSAVQAGNVTITYDLADDNWSTVEVDISSDGGSTWTVTDTSVSGDVGSSIVEGTSKSIIWNANTDFDEQEQADMRVRIRALDTYSNQSGYTSSANFSLDTVDPVVNVVANLKAQPNAGDSTVLIGGSFTEPNPNTNIFYVAINGGAYSSGTAGDTNTVTPADKATNVGATLDGNDYVSSVKITHTDDFGQTKDNENTNPNTAYKYVKPYTPQVPTVNNPSVGNVDVWINKHISETDGLEYAIYETSQSKYVQSDGTLGVTAVWQTVGTGLGQWGNNTGTSSKVWINGLTLDSYLYSFQVKSRNTSDASHAAANESAYSASASSANQSPQINISAVSQSTDGTKYVTINYTGTDLESETTTLVTYEYSLNNINWSTMTEKTGVGSDSTSSLYFSAAGTEHDFMWDVATDSINIEDTTVYVRLRANDGTSSGNIETSSAFTIDTKNPAIILPTASQIVGTNSVAFDYTLTDLSNSIVEIDISEDSGGTWVVTDTSVTGDVGSSIVPGSDKSITWDAGSDFNNQDQADMRVRIRAQDAYGNQGSYTSSANFVLDTANPVISNVSAAQDSGDSAVTINYDISDTNNSTVEIDVSSDGGSTWTVTDTSVTGDIGAGVSPGSSKSIVWDAGADFSGQDELDMKVRVRAYDIYANNSNVEASINFALDTLGPVIANVNASQIAGTDNIAITYNLTDNSAVTMAIDISEDGGNTWTVTDASVTGDVGAGILAGTGKSITWAAGTDFSGEDQNDIRVRVRGTDVYNNSSGNIESSDFSVDTKDPIINTTTNLTVQPNAGDVTATIAGSFTETNPNTNIFYIAINGGAYTTGENGDSNTAIPSSKATAVEATLDGNDYISGVKIAHTDDFGHSVNNENLAPTVAYKYVKPYTPAAPTVDNPQNTSVDITISKNASETTGLEYAIYENTTGQYVQANGTLGASAVWREIGTGVGQWGNGLVVAGKVAITGLSSPVAQYSFQVKSRNTSDPLDATTSESNLSASVSVINTAPVISISSVAQQTGGVNYVLINYTGTDTQNDTNNVTVYEYSIDNSTWHAMTEKTGVGSSGVSNLFFTTAGANFNFAWDVATDLAGVEDSTVYIRLQSSDGLANSNLVASSAFAVDNFGPIASNISVSQNSNTNIIVINYDLNDNTAANNFVELDISSDSGVTWVVTDSSVSGDIGSNISAGSNKEIIWNAGADFVNQEESDMKVRIRATDYYGNVGSYEPSADFTVDTKKPVVSTVTASQNVGNSNVVVSYVLSDISSSGNLVEISISDDSGSTWTVATSTVSGDIGSGQATGSKSFTWNAGADFNNQEQSDMRVRVRAIDYYGNVGDYSSSANFSLDTGKSEISNISASQTINTSNVEIDYDLSDGNSSNLTIEIDISSDGGSSWSVTDTSSTGDVGASLTTGLNKSITWLAGTDFSNQEQSDVRVRLRATDTYGNISDYFVSANFDVDTAGPLGLNSLSKFSATDTSVTLNWSAGIADTSFNHYEIWHGSNSADIDNRTGTAVKWDQINDSNLTNINTISTVITGLNILADYYVKIWAIDDYGNEVTVAAINVYEAPVIPPAVVEPSAGGGPSIESLSPDTVSPVKPILSPVITPTSLNNILISGLSEPRSIIDVYDNGVLIGRLNSTADSAGRFSQAFNFSDGSHILTAIATDFSNNASGLSDELVIVVDRASPAAAIILVPDNNSQVTSQTPEIIGVAESLARLTITIDGNQSFLITADVNGGWRFNLPSSAALIDGEHQIVVGISDQAGNIGSETSIRVVKVTPPTGTSTIVSEPSEIIPSRPLPPGTGISEVIEAIELPGVSVPTVSKTSVPVVDNNMIQFSGKSLPNKEVVVYIHSDQALIYQTRSDKDGNWTINHSQDVIELTPGQHSIYAVTVDPIAKVKSLPSEVQLFEIQTNFLAVLYNLLNIQTTAATLVMTLVAIFWLYRIRKRSLSLATV